MQQRSGVPRQPQTRHVFAQTRANPLPGAGACLSKAPFCAGRLGAAPLLQGTERGHGLPTALSFAFRPAPLWALCKA